MKIKRKKQAGSLSIEMMVAVGVMAALISVLAGVGSTFKKVNDQRWVRHTMLAAGQAQMDAIASTGKTIDENTFHRLWPTVTCHVEMTDGEAEWKGLEKIQVHLSAKSRQRTLKASLIRYIPAKWNAGILPALRPASCQARAGSPRSIVPAEKELQK